MPQYIQYPNCVTSASSTSTYTMPLEQVTIPFEQWRDYPMIAFADANESLPATVRELRDAVNCLRIRIDDIATISLKTESAMRSLKEYLEEYEAATIPVEEVMRFFWKDDDSE